MSAPAVLDRHVVAFNVTDLAEALSKSDRPGRARLSSSAVEPTDHRHRRLLRARHKWPRRHCAANERYEIAPPHSITSSAAASSVGGTVRPSILAVCAL